MRYVTNILASHLLAGALMAAPASAQWDGIQEEGLPLAADGTFDPAAPIRRTADGRPDLTGLWLIPDLQLHGWNIGKELKGGAPPRQAWTTNLVHMRKARDHIDDPSSRCYPSGLLALILTSPFRINTLDDRIIILFEQNTTYRQVFLDGRSPPDDLDPSYMGYSTGRWEGDTLVVETTGFNGVSWIDVEGHPVTEQLRLTERFRRTAFGKLEVEMTFDDPLAFTKPWSVEVPFNYIPNSDVSESFCEDNQFDDQLDDAGLKPLEVVAQRPEMVDAALPEVQAADRQRVKFLSELENMLQGLPMRKASDGIGVLLGKTMFDRNGKLSPEAAGIIDRIAGIMRPSGNIRAMIAGYADVNGDAAAEYVLSNRRALAVRQELIGRDVSSWQSIAYGLGAESIAAEPGSPGGTVRGGVEIFLSN